MFRLTLDGPQACARFKVPNWNLEARTERQVFAPRLHAGRCSHAIQRAAQFRAIQVNIVVMRAIVRSSSSGPENE